MFDEQHMERKFVVGDLVIYEEFKYRNTSKLTPIFVVFIDFLVSYMMKIIKLIDKIIIQKLILK